MVLKKKKNKAFSLTWIIELTIESGFMIMVHYMELPSTCHVLYTLLHFDTYINQKNQRAKLHTTRKGGKKPHLTQINKQESMGVLPQREVKRACHKIKI